MLSLFVQLQRDLSLDVREQTVERVEQLSDRVRWKQNTGAVEIPASRYHELVGLAGVARAEPGQTMHGPNPVIGSVTRSGPAPSARRVATQARRHHDGDGVLVGIIDVGGFDFAHEDFLARDGTTRWHSIWDQGGSSRRAPSETKHYDRLAFAGLSYGSEIQQDHMNAALRAATRRKMSATSLEPQSVMSVGSHGTHVASIAAGNRGVARRAYLAGVLVALRDEDLDASSSFYDTTRITDAVDYLLGVAAELGGEGPPVPVTINISLGTNGHAHDTSSAMARWIDNALTMSGRCVCVAAGNAGQVAPTSATDLGFVNGRIHAAGVIAGTNLQHELGWVVAAEGIEDISENELEIWYAPQDRFDVEVCPPGGSWIGPIHPGQKLVNQQLPDGTRLSVHSEAYHPANGANHISVLLSPFYGPITNGEQQIGPIAAGEWRVRLTGAVVRDGRYDAWIERDDAQPLSTRPGAWYFPSCFAPGSYADGGMISTLACAERLVAVANIDVANSRAHPTSSKGPTRDGRTKPDIGANGTEVLAARAFDRDEPWIQMTGTSMASPYVCGVTALMLAIAPQLTAAQLIGILRTTSGPLSGHDYDWRPDTGFGVINPGRCVDEAAIFEGIRRVTTS